MNNINYVKVDAYHLQREKPPNYGGYGIDRNMIKEEILRQFENGIVNLDGNFTAYIEIEGIKLEVTFVMDKNKPWENYYMATSKDTGKSFKSMRLEGINYSYILQRYEDYLI